MSESMSKAYQIIGARAGGKVERCHGIPHIGSYSNAAHSWGVAMLMQQIWPADFPRLAAACLNHDVPEAWAGDIPAPVMRYVPGVKEALAVIEDRLLERVGLPGLIGMDPEDYRKLKACDWLEFWLWCRDQSALGNKFAEQGQLEIEAYMDKQGLPEPAQEIYDKLRGVSTVALQTGVMRDIMEV